MSLLTRFFTAEPVVYTVITLNALTLFALGFMSPELPEAAICRAIDMACVAFFVLEAGFKIGKWGWRGYWGDGWNRFDFIVTALSLPALATPLLPGDFRAATLLRMGRFFRLFRLLRMIPNRDHLAKGVARALRASVGVFLALFLINFILALGATFLFRDQAPEHFGNPILANYTIFKAVTLEGWHEIPDLMADGSSSVWTQAGVRVFFIFIVVVCGILGLSMANAIFVDEMIMDNNDPLEDKIDALSKEIAELRALLTRPHGGRPDSGPPPSRFESPD